MSALPFVDDGHHRDPFPHTICFGTVCGYCGCCCHCEADRCACPGCADATCLCSLLPDPAVAR